MLGMEASPNLTHSLLANDLTGTKEMDFYYFIDASVNLGLYSQHFILFVTYELAQ